jgi:hypothetical protein
VGIALEVAIGAVFDNIGVGLAIGSALGVAYSASSRR